MQDFCIVAELQEVKANYRKGKDQFKIKVCRAAAILSLEIAVFIDWLVHEVFLADENSI